MGSISRSLVESLLLSAYSKIILSFHSRFHDRFEREFQEPRKGSAEATAARPASERTSLTHSDVDGSPNGSPDITGVEALKSSYHLIPHRTRRFSSPPTPRIWTQSKNSSIGFTAPAFTISSYYTTPYYTTNPPPDTFSE